MSDFHTDFKALKKPFNTRLLLTAAFAAGVSLSAVALLGLSGWFLTAAAIAGAGGTLTVQAFNYLLPSALIRLFAITRTVFRYGERYLGHSAALRTMARLRPALFGRVVRAAPQATLALSRGEASSRFIQDITTLENALVLQSVPIAAVTGMATAIAFAAFCGVAAMLVLIAGMGVTLALGWAVMRRAGDAPVSEQAAMGALKARFHELLNLLPDIQTCDLRDTCLAELTALEDRLRQAKTATVSKDALAAALVTVMTGVWLSLMAMVSLHASLAGLALALLAATMGFESLGVLLRYLGQRDAFITARQRVAALYDQPVAEPATTAGRLFGLYDLDASLRLRIDGPSGSGKTRLIETVIGLRDGADRMDGHLFALCPQDAAILTGTIRDNLLVAFDDATLAATPKTDVEARMHAALDDAALSARVMALPKGLDTWIGDGGVALSGGERKRLSLARAYLRDAEVLILDEPTEGLDLATEAVVVERLEQRLQRTGQGLILISHREAPRRLATGVYLLTP